MATKKTVKTTKPKKAVAAPKEAKASKVAAPVKKPASAKSAPKTAAPVEIVMNLENKQQIIEQFAQKKGDTGSPEVQVALLSFKITRLAGHLDINKKDNHSRRGLLKVIAKRRRILNYLQKLDEKRYKELLGKVQLKK